MIHPLLGALLLLGAATVHAQGAPAGSYEPAYSVEWNEKNRYDLCFAQTTEANCRDTIELGFRLAGQAVAAGRMDYANALLEMSNEAALRLAEAAPAGGRSPILEVQYRRHLAYMADSGRIELADPAALMAAALAYYMLEEDRWSSAREVIAKIREWRASRAGIERRLTGGIELRGGKSACDVAVRHFAAEGVVRSGLFKYADTPEGRQLASATDDDYTDLQRIVYGDCGVSR